MSLTRLTADLNNVSALADQPTESASELKNVFDKAGNTIKDYINNTLIPEIDQNFFSAMGGTLDGTLTTQTIIPKTTGTYNLGSSTNVYNRVYGNMIVQKHPTRAGGSVMSSHAYGFAWTSTGFRLIVDGDQENFFLPISNHSMTMNWTGSHLAVYVDGTFVGNAI